MGNSRTESKDHPLSEAEKEEAELLYEEQKEHGFREQNLKDLLEHNSTKGYDAV